MIAVAFVLLSLAALGFLARLLIGRSVADRIIALDGLLLVAVMGLAVEATRTGRSTFVDAIVVVSLLGFVGTSIAARFVERRGG